MDVLRFPGRDDKSMLGGVVYYAGRAFERLGVDTAIITKAAKEDLDELTKRFRGNSVTVHRRDSERTTVFENQYLGLDLHIRRQEIGSIANAFEIRDLAQVTAKWFFLGPLTRAEMSPEFLRAVSKRCERVFLDVQGFVRKVECREVRLFDWPDKRQGLSCVDVLKANSEEALILSGEANLERAARKIADLGPREVIITLGREGSLILAEGRFHRIPAFPPKTLVDPTGAGDTYSAGYVFQRLRSDDIEASGRFAAALASRKLENYGPFAGDANDVLALLRQAAAENEILR